MGLSEEELDGAWLHFMKQVDHKEAAAILALREGLYEIFSPENLAHAVHQGLMRFWVEAEELERKATSAPLNDPGDTATGN